MYLPRANPVPTPGIPAPRGLCFPGADSRAIGAVLRGASGRVRVERLRQQTCSDSALAGRCPGQARSAESPLLAGRPTSHTPSMIILQQVLRHSVGGRSAHHALRSVAGSSGSGRLKTQRIGTGAEPVSNRASSRQKGSPLTAISTGSQGVSRAGEFICSSANRWPRCSVPGSTSRAFPVPGQPLGLNNVSLQPNDSAGALPSGRFAIGHGRRNFTTEDERIQSSSRPQCLRTPPAPATRSAARRAAAARPPCPAHAPPPAPPAASATPR